MARVCEYGKRLLGLREDYYINPYHSFLLLSSMVSGTDSDRSAVVNDRHDIHLPEVYDLMDTFVRRLCEINLCNEEAYKCL